MFSLIFLAAVAIWTGSFGAAVILYLPFFPLFLLFDMLLCGLIEGLRGK